MIHLLRMATASPTGNMAPSNLRLCCAMLFLILATPGSVYSQFQQPTPEELKMTADPKAPGAAAVYLNVTRISNPDLHFEGYYARIKVLAEKGMELATVELPYQKHLYDVADIKARTIQPDGTIIPLTGKPADLLKTKTKGFQSGRKVFTLPNAQVGSILEYYFQIRYDSDHIPIPYWEVQFPYLVHKSHYQCIGCSNLSYWSVLPVGITVAKDRMGHLELNMVDVPPSPKEEWMPPMESLLYKVEFYNSSPRSVDDFWKGAGDDWFNAVNLFTEPSKTFRDQMNGLIAPGDSDLDKARKLYKAVQALDNTDFSREKGENERKKLKIKEINRAEDVWTEKSGTRTEIALLYLSMLRSAGLTAYAMRLVNRNQGLFTPSDLDFDQLDDTIIILSAGGKEILLDPGEKMCPFQTVHWSHSRTGGIRQFATGSGVATSSQQPYNLNTIDRIADLTLDAQGTVDGNMRIVMSGQEALHWRQIALKNDNAEVMKQFDEWLAEMVPDGVQAHIDHFTALDDPDSKLVSFIKVQGAAGTATSKHLLVPGLFLETRRSHPFVDEEKRQTPVDMQYGEQVADQVIYHLPPGLEVESAPQPGKIPWEGHAVLLINSKTEPGQVTVTSTLARAFALAKTEEYQD
ncbi:MAG: DUF3857 domain-containing protein, partial [Terracidiphilus sp.]